MNWKGCGRKRSWPNFRYNTNICLEGLKKTTKVLCQDKVLYYPSNTTILYFEIYNVIFQYVLHVSALLFHHQTLVWFVHKHSIATVLF
jgi:hypothetical protein